MHRIVYPFYASSILVHGANNIISAQQTDAK